MLPSKGMVTFSNKNYSNVKATIVKTENLYTKNKISFFGAEPIEQQTIDYSIESIVNALKAYGLVSQDTFWYLQEGPFKGTDGPDIPYYQGFSVDLSADGNTAVVGGPGYELVEGTKPLPGNTGGIGGVWVFTRDSLNVWKQQQTIIPGGYTGFPSFGWSVCISGDGNTIAFGGISDEDVNGWLVGATWVYTLVNGVWIYQSKLVGTGYTPDKNIYQGYSVSLSYFGDTLIVGGPNNNTILTLKGAIWIFQKIDGTWTQQAGPIIPEIDGSILESFYTGQFVDVSNDGNTMVTTGILEGSNLLLIWVYTRTDEEWTKHTEFVVNVNSDLYIPITISGDGNTFAIGRSLESSTGSMVDVYVKTNNVWSYQASLLGSGSYNSQGITVSLSDDGNTIGFTGFVDAGSSLWIFNRDEYGIWTQNGTDIYIGGSTVSAQLSGDGKTLISGFSNDQEIRIYKN